MAIVLVVEDEDSVRSLVERILKGEGHVVLTAASGAAALEVVAGMTGMIDMLITDMKLPGMDGREVAARLRAIYPEIAVVYITGFADAELVRGARDASINLLEKPFKPADLVNKIRRLIV